MCFRSIKPGTPKFVSTCCLAFGHVTSAFSDWAVEGSQAKYISQNLEPKEALMHLLHSEIKPQQGARHCYGDRKVMAQKDVKCLTAGGRHHAINTELNPAVLTDSWDRQCKNMIPCKLRCRTIFYLMSEGAYTVTPTFPRLRQALSTSNAAYRSGGRIAFANFQTERPCV